MQVKTILNRIQKHRGCVYGAVRLEDQRDGLALTVDIYPHARNRPRCSGCGQRGVHYDRLEPRRFEFVRCGAALHILDRFHIAKHMSDAIDQVRRAEVHGTRSDSRGDNRS